MRLPSGYRLDESDPDVLLLRRADGTVAGVFSARGATAKALGHAARKDLEGRVGRSSRPGNALCGTRGGATAPPAKGGRPPAPPP